MQAASSRLKRERIRRILKKRFMEKLRM